MLKQACRDGLFSKPVAAAIKEVPALDTKELDAFMRYPDGDNPLAQACKNGTCDDRQTLFYIADRLTERAAKLSAINLAAMALKTGRGIDPTRPICIVAEGTTFYKMKSVQSRVAYYLKLYLENKKGVFTEIVHVDNATLIGAAIAGLTN